MCMCVYVCVSRDLWFNQLQCQMLPSSYQLVMDVRKDGDPKGWSTVLVTAGGSWEKTSPVAMMSLALDNPSLFDEAKHIHTFAHRHTQTWSVCIW
jgi:hypothetical protein